MIDETSMMRLHLLEGDEYEAEENAGAENEVLGAPYEDDGTTRNKSTIFGKLESHHIMRAKRKKNLT